MERNHRYGIFIGALLESCCTVEIVESTTGNHKQLLQS